MMLRLLFALGCLTACAPSGSDDPPPRNVVLVVLDSVRADHVGAYGYERPTTPRLDALASKGIQFERAYAGSSAAPQSLSALWTESIAS